MQPEIARLRHELDELRPFLRYPAPGERHDGTPWGGAVIINDPQMQIEASLPSPEALEQARRLLRWPSELRPGTVDASMTEPEILAPGHVRLRLTVAYDGTNYFGWQRQRSDDSVQQRVEAALAKLFPSPPCLYGSSRTDTGVHAVGMVAHFDVPRVAFRMEPRKLVLAVNAHLPEDIRVMSAARARADFHARYSASGKQYRYLVWNHPAHQPLLRTQAWHYPRALDVAAMRAAAATLVGRHDFLAFSATPGYARRHTIRNVTRCEVKRAGSLITVIIEADGFLYKMCRGIVGTLVQVGIGRFKPGEVLPMLASRNRSLAGMTAPGHGLVLWKVYYRRKGPPALAVIPPDANEE